MKIQKFLVNRGLGYGLQPRGFYRENIMEMCYLINEEVEDSEMFESTEVLDRAYSSVTAKEVAAQQAHLTKEEQANLEKVLSKYSTIFDGELGCYPHKKIKLDIPPDAQPIRKRLYPIPYEMCVNRVECKIQVILLKQGA